MLKTCSKCKKEKNISEFNKRSDRNAYRSHCKACVKIYLQLQDPRKIKLQRKNYNLKNKNKMNEWARNKHDATNGHYSRIKYQVRKAILTGIIKKTDCIYKNERCFGQIQAHHHDYTKPIDVRFMCIEHHSAWHRLFQAEY